MTSSSFFPSEAPTTPLGGVAAGATPPPGDHAASGIGLGSVIADRYRLVAIIGEGGSGRVYQAIDLAQAGGSESRELIALKILTHAFEETAGHFAALSAHFGRWRRLRHANIVKLFECDRVGSTVFITMEYLAGESVYVKLHKHSEFAGTAASATVESASSPAPEAATPLSPEEARPIITSVADALDYAHHQGVVHGDLKPGNIIVGESCGVKVVDFGMTRWLSRPGSADAIPAFAATPRYASPQMLAGDKPKPGDDVFSLACVAYEMLTGVHPFDGALGARPGEPPQRRGLGVGEYQAIAHALQSDADKRTATIQEFLAEFTQRAVRPAARWPVWLGLAAIAVVGFVYLRPWSHSSSSPPPSSAPSSAQAPRNGPTAHAPGSLVQDCATCPSMTVLAAGEFEQGADAGQSTEAPRHRVQIGYPLAVSTTDVTVADFRAFILSQRRDMQGCDVYTGEWIHRPVADWEDPGFAQSDRHPVTCISWNDAVAYAEWLSAKSGHRYRLPSASEWEYAARAGADSARPWGADAASICSSANVADRSAERRFPGWTVFPCEDGYVYTAPAGSFSPNAFGLRDMLGNVLVWTQDCWQAVDLGSSSDGSPSDSSPRTAVDCREHEVRGASWFTAPDAVAASYRNHFATDYRTSSIGFRLVRDLE